jgi:hypothetical protein
MDRYLIESPHTAEECHNVIEQFSAAGYLYNFDWGCADGVHCGWAIIETDSVSHASQIVPWSVRSKARIVKLVKFEPDNPYHPAQPR